MEKIIHTEILKGDDYPDGQTKLIRKIKDKCDRCGDKTDFNDTEGCYFVGIIDGSKSENYLPFICKKCVAEHVKYINRTKEERAKDWADCFDEMKRKDNDN